jgi:hypothetical protein
LRTIGANRRDDTARLALPAAIGQGVLFGFLHIGTRSHGPAGFRMGKDAALRPEKADLGRAKKPKTAMMKRNMAHTIPLATMPPAGINNTSAAMT